MIEGAAGSLECGRSSLGKNRAMGDLCRVLLCALCCAPCIYNMMQHTTASADAQRASMFDIVVGCLLRRIDACRTTTCNAQRCIYTRTQHRCALLVVARSCSAHDNVQRTTMYLHMRKVWVCVGSAHYNIQQTTINDQRSRYNVRHATCNAQRCACTRTLQLASTFVALYRPVDCFAPAQALNVAHKCYYGLSR
jgi:hypothetical protein